ncbi:origin recognition complex subunit 3-like [Diadema antillarum]|uniref:origin recognition complex subunit 3-like n=1 Tax=Diadema antillarum TaxID=105358 RepID=UPI003A8B8FCF
MRCIDYGLFYRFCVLQGCFVFKSKRKREPLAPGDYFIPENKADTNKDCKLRYETCEVQWDLISEDVEVLQTEVNRKIFDDLLSFIKNAQAGFNLDFQPAGSNSKFQQREIPTAAFVTGVNVTDHHDIFNKLTSVFHERVSPHVASLTSKDCTTLKSLMGALVSQLMGIEYLVSEDDETRPDVNLKKVPCTFPVLQTWYKDNVQKHKSCISTVFKSPRRSRKRRSASGPVSYPEFPPIIIIFEDIEGFKPVVIQDFIHICSQYLDKLPIVLTFGIATSVGVIHRLLPQSASSCLSMEKFQAEPSSVYLSQVIDKVLLTAKHPFKLGSKVFQFLLDLFLYHDFSVMNFVQGLQFAVLDHYFSQPLSLLCCRHGDAISRIRNLSHEQLELFRQLQSFRRFVDGCPASDQRALLLDDKHMKKVLQELLKKLSDYHKTFYPTLRCLHILSESLPYHPLGKQMRELYALASEGDIYETDGYKESFKYMKLFARDELLTKMTLCEETLASFEGLQESRFQIETLQAKLETLGDSCNQPVEDNDSEEGKTKKRQGSKEEEVMEEGCIQGKTTLHSLQQKLMYDARKQRKMTRYEALRNEILDFFDSLFRQYLTCPMNQPLHEVCYYNDISELRQRLNASPRAAIQTALSNPYYYLQNSECEKLGDGISNTLPDLCIVYKLHLECGRLINLYDWLQAFITVVQGDSHPETSDTTSKPDSVLQARFIRAVSELQFLGFVKPTRKKTDHVARLTWGGC